jgi:hypothetical protein
LVGWGRAIATLLEMGESKQWAGAGALGMAFSICMGGLLNLLDIVSPAILITYVLFGLLLFLLGFPDHWKRRSEWLNEFRDAGKISRSFSLLLFALLLLRFLGEAAPPYYFFQAHDDFQAYLAHPIKMLQTGSIGSDPFSERRLSSLGGQAFLQALLGAVIGPEHFRFLDAGVALLIILGFAIHFAREHNLQLNAINLVILWILLAVPPDINVTTMLIGAALFFYLFRLLTLENGNQFASNRAVVISIVAAAICAAKTTLIPALGLILFLHFGYQLCRNRFPPRLLLELFLITTLTALLLAPWMLLMWRSSGTPLFPLLGKGYHATSYGVIYKTPLTIRLAVEQIRDGFKNPFYLALLAVPLASIRKSGSTNQRSGSIAFSIASIAALVVIMLSIQSFATDPYRYSFPFLLVLVIIAFTYLLSAGRLGPVSTSDLVAGLIALSLGFNARSIAQRYYLYAKVRTFGFREASIASPRDLAIAAAVQRSVPSGAPILARLEKNFLFDFNRNPILIIDLPGGSSLPPGMPLSFAPEALAHYFQSKGIRYVGYAYASGATFSRKTHRDRLSEKTPKWFKVQAELVFIFQDNLDALGKSRKRIYHDGQIFVLDLARTSLR